MCVTPIPLKVENQNTFDNLVQAGLLLKSSIVHVPCNQCIECRREHVAQWKFRVLQQFKAKDTREAHFITLTYADEFLEDFRSGLYTQDMQLTLNYSHFQKFMKRCRKQYKDQASYPIRYLTTGEYGDKTGRPHFHALAFNLPQQLVLDNWHYGNPHFGEINEATINYTLKYALKRAKRAHDKTYKKEWKDEADRLLNSALRKQNSQLIFPEEERKLVSLGMGLNYLTPQIINSYKKDVDKTPILDGNVRIGLPRYYKEKIYTPYQILSRTKRAIEKQESRQHLDNDSERRALAQRDYIKSQEKEAFRKKNGY